MKAARCELTWHFCFRGNFMFLKPSLSEMSIIYTLPFSRTVWITYALIVAVLTVALVISMRTEQNISPSQHYHPLRWSDAALSSLGIVCQQGKSLTYSPNKCALLCIIDLTDPADSVSDGQVSPIASSSTMVTYPRNTSR